MIAVTTVVIVVTIVVTVEVARDTQNTLLPETVVCREGVGVALMHRMDSLLRYPLLQTSCSQSLTVQGCLVH